MKNLVGKAIFAIVILGIVFWVFSSKTTEKQSKIEKEKLETKQHVETKNIVSAMIAKHNAVADWRKCFGEKGISLLDHTYTIEIQDALIKTDGRPILFFGSVNDIVRKDDNFVVYFSNLFDDLLGSWSPANVRFVLECTALQVDKILKKPTEKFNFNNNFAVIAQITEVKKNRFQLTADPSGNENIDIRFAPSNVFMATGNCLDLVFVGDYRLGDSLEVYSGGVIKKKGKKKGRLGKILWDTVKGVFR